MLSITLQFAKPFLSLSPIWIQQEADWCMADDDSPAIREGIRHVQARAFPDATIMGCTRATVDQMESPAVHFNVQSVRQAGQEVKYSIPPPSVHVIQKLTAGNAASV